MLEWGGNLHLFAALQAMRHPMKKKDQKAKPCPPGKAFVKNINAAMPLILKKAPPKKKK